MFDLLSKKAFESKKIQESWKVHQNAFGPILNDAFKEDYKTKIDVCAALNMISNRKLQEGYQKVTSLYDKCQCNEDYALFYFMLGLCFEMANQKEDMASAYLKCCEYEPNFYLPFNKAAKFMHEIGEYEIAAGCYQKGLDILTLLEDNIQNKTLIASTLVNFATCFTLMHEYEMAKELFDKSKLLHEVMVGRSGSEAMLYAALKDEEQMKCCLEKVKVETPQIYEHIKKESEMILNNKNPHFTNLDVDLKAVETFWNYFETNQLEMYPLFISEDESKYPLSLYEQLNEVFIHVNRPVDLHIEIDHDVVVVVLHDGYCMSKTHGLIQLLEHAPKQMKAKYRFEIRR